MLKDVHTRVVQTLERIAPRYADAVHDAANGLRHVYSAPPTKKVARHKKTIALWDALRAIADRYDIIGTRSLFYQAESAGLVPKTEEGYTQVQRALVAMRREGLLSYDKIQDTQRARRRDFMVSGLSDAAEGFAANMRYDYWLDQPVWIEVWSEKDGMVSVLQPICDAFGIYFAALRGFESESFTYSCAQTLKRVQKPVKIFYLGDHDPGGWWIARTLEDDLRRFGANVEVRQLAVLPWQIDAFGLRTRLGREKERDSRLRGFVHEFGSDRCVEVDAIPPDVLQAIVYIAIHNEIDWDAWQRAQAVERAMEETNTSVMQVLARLQPGSRLTLAGD